MTFGFTGIEKQILDNPDAKGLNHRCVETAYAEHRITLIERLDLLSLLSECQLIFLTRHGETYWNTLHKCQTWSNTPDTYLTSDGKKDASKKGRMIKGKHIELAIHSALERTKQTCEIMLKAANLQHLPVYPDARMNDGNLSYMDGTTADEFREKYPAQAEARKSDKWNYRLPYIEGFPRAESMQDSYERVSPLLQSIIEDRKNVLLVGHRSINRVILFHFLNNSKYNITKENIGDVKIPNEGVYEIALLRSGEKYLLHNINGKNWDEGLIIEQESNSEGLA